MTSSNLRAILLTVLMLPGAAAAALFGPDESRWAYFSAHAAQPSTEVHHAPWQALLDRYLITDHPSGINRFRYGAVTPDDTQRLERYLTTLQRLDPRKLSPDQQMAYWINLYNALTVKLILDHPGVESIRDISSGLFSSGPWDRELATIAGKTVTLNDIEHRILRPIFEDARIHFAVNCASLGCPNLQPEAYTAGNLESLLERGAREYINHPRGVALTERALKLSSIFEWYRSDFPEGRDALLEWLAGYAEPALAEQLCGYEGRVEHAYDWRLNAPDVRWEP